MNKGLVSWMLSFSLRIRRILCVLDLAVIAVLSLVPAWLFPESVTRIPGIDLWAHLLMYGSLGFLLRWAAGPEPLPAAARWLPAGAAAYGLLMEVLQLLVSSGSRCFGWDDAAANLAGAILFWWAAGRIFCRSSDEKS